MGRKKTITHPYRETGARLRRLIRAKKGISRQSDIIVELSHPTEAVKRWLVGAQRPKGKSLKLLSEYLDMSVDELRQYLESEEEIIVVGDSFADRIWLLMDMNDLTQAEVAEATGIQRDSISRYCAGAIPSTTNLLSIANHFGVTTDWLLGRPGAEMRVARKENEDG